MLIIAILAVTHAITGFAGYVLGFAGILAALTTAVAALGGLIKAMNATGLGRPLKWVWRHLVGQPATEAFEKSVGKVLDEKIVPIQDHIEKVRDDVEWCAAQLRNNGGSSLRDKVDATWDHVSNCPILKEGADVGS